MSRNSCHVFNLGLELDGRRPEVGMQRVAEWESRVGLVEKRLVPRFAVVHRTRDVSLVPLPQHQENEFKKKKLFWIDLIIE